MNTSDDIGLAYEAWRISNPDLKGSPESFAAGYRAHDNDPKDGGDAPVAEKAVYSPNEIGFVAKQAIIAEAISRAEMMAANYEGINARLGADQEPTGDYARRDASAYILREFCDDLRQLIVKARPPGRTINDELKMHQKSHELEVANLAALTLLSPVPKLDGEDIDMARDILREAAEKWSKRDRP